MAADVDPDTLIHIVRSEIKSDKAPGIDNVYNDFLKKAIGTGFYTLLARAFAISLKLGYIPHVWKVAVLCMLIKPDKPPSQTTSYRPISLLSAIMKSMSTNDHPFPLSQTIMESFDWGEHVIACQESLQRCLAQWTQVQNLPA